MTDALYNRIEAIETLRRRRLARTEKSADLAALRGRDAAAARKTDTAAARLLAVIEHDVKRLDRLITDISDASRLDAELQRQDVAPVDLRRLLTTLASVANETKLGHDVGVRAALRGHAAATRFSVPGHDSRLGQVISNLLANAQSFSQPGGKVRVTCRRRRRRDRDRRRRRRPRHPPRRAGAHLRALLHRPPAPGLRPELRPRPVDLQADHRGAWRTHLGREPPRPDVRRRRRADGSRARASSCGCRRHERAAARASTPRPCWSATRRC